MAISAKKHRQYLKSIGSFYTGNRLAVIIRDEIGKTNEVYDPTCGSGNLLSVFPDECAKYGQELDAQQLEETRRTLVNFSGVVGDTLKHPAFIDRKFKAIAANPPFSVKWDMVGDARFDSAPCLPPSSRADWAFILHCLYMLADGGTAAILCFPGALYRGQREGKIREWLVRQNVVEKVVQFEGGYFEDTNISTSLLVLKKGRVYNSTKFVDYSSGNEHTATFEEIEKNNFNLSVSSYVQPPIEKEETIDPWELEKQCRTVMLKKLYQDIQQSEMACLIEGWDLNPFLDELAIVIDSFRRTKANETTERMEHYGK